MTYRIGPLNTSAGLSLLALSFYFALNYGGIMEADPHWQASLATYALLGLLALVVDFFFQLLMKNRWLLKRMQWIIVVLFFILTLLGDV